jgi:hypothetical protein
VDGVRITGAVPAAAPSEALIAPLTGVPVLGESAPFTTTGVPFTDAATTGLAHPATGAAARPPVAEDGFDGMTDVSLALVNMRDADCC